MQRDWFLYFSKITKSANTCQYTRAVRWKTYTLPFSQSNLLLQIYGPRGVEKLKIRNNATHYNPAPWRGIDVWRENSPLIGEQGWRSGESTRLPPMWPGFDSGPVPYVGWVCCWFSFLLRRFFSGFSGFPPSTKTNTPNSNWIFMHVHVLTSSWALQCHVGK